MSNPDDALTTAAQFLDHAARHSVNGEVTSAMAQLEHAETALRCLGKAGSANLVRDIREGDVCHPSVAFELRQVAQFLFVGDQSGFRYPEVVER